VELGFGLLTGLLQEVRRKKLLEYRKNSGNREFSRCRV
jgi:hypothetical protein